MLFEHLHHLLLLFRVQRLLHVLPDELELRGTVEAQPPTAAVAAEHGLAGLIFKEAGASRGRLLPVVEQREFAFFLGSLPLCQSCYRLRVALHAVRLHGPSLANAKIVRERHLHPHDLLCGLKRHVLVITHSDHVKARRKIGLHHHFWHFWLLHLHFKINNSTSKWTPNHSQFESEIEVSLGNSPCESRKGDRAKE